MTRCDASITEPTPNYLYCESCDGYFYREPQRGRPPKMCEWAKNNNANKLEQAKKEKKESVKEGLTAIPILETVSNVKVGETLLVQSSMFSDEISSRLYAKEVKVLNVEGDKITVVRAAKTDFKEYPAVISLEKLRRKSGTEYLFINKYDNVEYEGNENDE